MNKYIELKQNRQAEINAFPVHFAFGDKQIEAKIKELKLSKDPKKRAEQIVPIGAGGFVLKEDYPAWNEMWDRLDKAHEKAISEDRTGDGYIHDMFLYELDNHEYSYTMDETEAILSLGYNWDDIRADPRLAHGLQTAAKEIRAREDFGW